MALAAQLKIFCTLALLSVTSGKLMIGTVDIVLLDDCLLLTQTSVRIGHVDGQSRLLIIFQ